MTCAYQKSKTLTKVLTSIVVVILPVTVYFAKSYFNLTAQLESMLNNKTELTREAMSSNEALVKKRDEIGQAFLKNRYVLNANDQASSEVIDISTICQQKNSVNCVFPKDGEIVYLGNHETF